MVLTKVIIAVTNVITWINRFSFLCRAEYFCCVPFRPFFLDIAIHLKN